MDYKSELKSILKENKTTGKEMSEKLGISYDYFRRSTQKKGLKNRVWVRSFVIGYELGKKNGEKGE